MACSNCKKLKHDLEIAKRSSTARAGLPGDSSEESNQINLALQERDKALISLAGLISSGLEFAEISKSMDLSDPASIKRWESKLSFLERYIEEAMQKASIVNVDIAGQEYNAGLSVEAINLGEFTANDVLVIDEVIKPMLLFKPKSDDNPRLLQAARVTVKRKDQE